MSLPLVHPLTNHHSWIRGDVTIHPSVVIAPGVILQAGTGSQIIIAAGVCIGMGTILHAHEGIIEVEEGASLGAGVLLVGQVRIGANACIGASTTILDGSIERDQTVSAGSLIGDTSRQIAASSTVSSTVPIAPPSQNGALEATSSVPELTLVESVVSSKPDQPAPMHVYGQVYVNQLMVKLLPNRKLPQVATVQSSQPPDDVWED